MIIAQRNEKNPIIKPVSHNPWEELATFNGSVVRKDDTYHMLYRAMSKASTIEENVLQLSTIGSAESTNGVDFERRIQLISPTEEWEKYGCEDPRITFFEGKYYIFYTALSKFPFGPEGIKVALATTHDFQTIETKSLITPFNAKAGCLFPERVKGKIAMLLTVNTDMPPSKIGIAYFDDEMQMQSSDYWNDWYAHLDEHALSLSQGESDHVELGAPPIKTDKGWLLIYCHIRNYFSPYKIFGIEAMLLDFDDPKKILGRTHSPLLVPREDYELYGVVPNIVFPSGAVIDDDEIKIYYGGADTRVCVATCSLRALLDEITIGNRPMIISKENAYLTRYEYNPILIPVEAHPWEQKAVFNPAAVLINDTVHMLYRAWSPEDISTVGYCASTDGFTFTDRSEEPVYVPRADFEKNSDGRNFGCEDARITQIDGRIYITYTAYDGHNPPRIGMSSMSVDDFVQKNWKAWNQPILISPPGIDDKDCAILPEKINDQYLIYHRIDARIWVDFVDSLGFTDGKLLQGFPWLAPRKDKWDDLKIGIAGPPVRTEKGWIFMYHGISSADHAYRLGALLLDLEDPTKIISRIDDPILEPVMQYEQEGVVPHVVFPCGAVIKDDKLFVYYGGADKVVGIAYCNIQEFLAKFDE